MLSSRDDLRDLDGDRGLRHPSACTEDDDVPPSSALEDDEEDVPASSALLNQLEIMRLMLGIV